jgi:hypothetical protein
MLIGILLVYNSNLSVAYGRACVAAAVQLLEKVCKGVKHAQFGRTYTDIPVACLNLVALVEDFRDQNQVCLILSAGCPNI